jgi:hypothetical protein
MNDWASDKEAVVVVAEHKVAAASTPKRRTKRADAGIVNAVAAGTANNEKILALITMVNKKCGKNNYTTGRYFQ